MGLNVGFEVYLVGGAVRDGLLGLKIYDRDWVVVGATPEEMLAEGFQQVGKDFPVFLHPKSREEYALARTERKAGVGYHGFEVFADPSVTLEEDLIRRDLTINAMAESATGVMVDPYGGQEDLKKKQLRHVSAAFAEDPLRVLRVARFAAKLACLEFEVAPETQVLMARMVQGGELADLTPERVWQEMVKAFNTPRIAINPSSMDIAPAPGISMITGMSAMGIHSSSETNQVTKTMILRRRSFSTSHTAGI